MGMVNEFKQFSLKGNFVDMAVGIVIGGAFGKIVSSFVGDILGPIIALVSGGTDFSAHGTVIGTSAAGEEVTMLWGAFVQNGIDFLIVAMAIFLVVKVINTAKKQFEKEEEAAPAKPSAEVQLLTEIRDSLSK